MMKKEAIKLIKKQIDMNIIQEQNIKTWCREKPIAKKVKDNLYENIKVLQYILNVLTKEK